MQEALITSLLDHPIAAHIEELELRPSCDDGAMLRRADLVSVFCLGLPDSHPFMCRPASQWESINIRRVPPGWRVGFEIKVSRADLLSDVSQRMKQEPLARVMNELYYVHPRGIVSEDESFRLPWHAGRIEVYRDHRPQWLGKLRAKIVRQSKINIFPETPPWLLANLLHAANWRGFVKPANGPARKVHQAEKAKEPSGRIVHPA